MRPPLWFVAIVAVILGTFVVRVFGDIPPTTVDGLRVMTVSEVLDARAAGGLRNQPVAVGGYWTWAEIGHSCFAGERSELEIGCHDDEYGITELNEPVIEWNHYAEAVYQARGPVLTPYLARNDRPIDVLYVRQPNFDQYPPTPIVVVGHFDDPLAERCHPERRQDCRDRLVVDRVAYFNLSLARWAPGIPTPKPTDPLPATPSVYGGG